MCMCLTDELVVRLYECVCVKLNGVYADFTVYFSLDELADGLI